MYWINSRGHLTVVVLSYEAGWDSNNPDRKRLEYYEMLHMISDLNGIFSSWLEPMEGGGGVCEHGNERNVCCFHCDDYEHNSFLEYNAM
jgi:hypothetical protein